MNRWEEYFEDFFLRSWRVRWREEELKTLVGGLGARWDRFRVHLKIEGAWDYLKKGEDYLQM